MAIRMLFCQDAVVAGIQNGEEIVSGRENLPLTILSCENKLYVHMARQRDS